MFTNKVKAQPDIILRTDNGEVKLPEAALQHFSSGCKLTTVIADIMSGQAEADADSDIIFNEDGTFIVDADSNDLQLLVRYMRAKISKADIGHHFKGLGSDKLHSLRTNAGRWEFDALEQDLDKFRVPQLSEWESASRGPAHEVAASSSSARVDTQMIASPHRNRPAAGDTGLASTQRSTSKRPPDTSVAVVVPAAAVQPKRSSFFGAAKPDAYSQQFGSLESPSIKHAQMPRNTAVSLSNKASSSSGKHSLTHASVSQNKFANNDGQQAAMMGKTGVATSTKKMTAEQQNSSFSKRVSFTGAAGNNVRVTNEKQQHRPVQVSNAKNSASTSGRVRVPADDAEQQEDIVDVDDDETEELQATYARGAEKRNAVGPITKPMFGSSHLPKAPRVGLATPAMALIEKQRNQQGQQRIGMQQPNKPAVASNRSQPGRQQRDPIKIIEANGKKQECFSISRPGLQSKTNTVPSKKVAAKPAEVDTVGDDDDDDDEDDSSHHAIVPEKRNGRGAAATVATSKNCVPASKPAASNRANESVSSTRNRDLSTKNSSSVIEDDDDNVTAPVISKKPLRSATAEGAALSQPSKPANTAAKRPAMKQLRAKPPPEIDASPVADDDDDLPEVIEKVDTAAVARGGGRGRDATKATTAAATDRRDQQHKQQQANPSSKRRFNTDEAAGNERSVDDVHGDDAVDIEELAETEPVDDEEEKSDMVSSKRKAISFVKSLSKVDCVAATTISSNKKSKPAAAPPPPPSRPIRSAAPLSSSRGNAVRKGAASVAVANHGEDHVTGSHDAAENDDVEFVTDDSRLAKEKEPVKKPTEEEGPLILVAPNGDELLIDHVEQRSYDYYFPFPEADAVDASQPQHVPSAVKLAKPQPKMAMTFRCAVDVDQDESLIELARMLAKSGRTLNDAQIEPDTLRDFINEKLAALQAPAKPFKICYIKPPLLASVIDAVNKQQQAASSTAAISSSSNMNAVDDDGPPTGAAVDPNASFCSTVSEAEKAVKAAVDSSQLDEALILGHSDAPHGMGMIDQLALHEVCNAKGIYF